MHMFTAAAIAATLFAASVTPATAKKGAYAELTARFSPATGQYCIRSGWASATGQTRRTVRAGECRTSSEWLKRGLAFAPAAPAAPPERLAAR